MEVPEKFLPDPEGTKSDVTQAPSPAASEGAKTQEAEVPERSLPPKAKEPEAEQKGSKTDERNLYAALEEERRMRRELQEKLKEVQTAPSNETTEFSDEGVALKGEIGTVMEKVRSLEEQLQLEALKKQHPELEGVESELAEFRKDYPFAPLERVARLFLAEKGILGVPQRKGLESPNGGTKQVQPLGMTQDDVKRLREQSPRKYIQLIRSGKLDPDSIK